MNSSAIHSISHSVVHSPAHSQINRYLPTYLITHSLTYILTLVTHRLFTSTHSTMHPFTHAPISSTNTHIPLSTHELTRLLTHPHSPSYLFPNSPLIPNNHLTVHPQPQPHPHLSNYSPAQTGALLPTHSRGFPCCVQMNLLCSILRRSESLRLCSFSCYSDEDMYTGEDCGGSSAA